MGKFFIFLITIITTSAYVYDRPYLVWFIQKVKPHLPTIAGGGDAPDGTFPFMVSIQGHNSQDGFPFCSGVLVSRTWVLTSASCSVSLNLQWTWAVVGAQNLKATEDSQQRIPIAEVIIHNDYRIIQRDRIFQNDIALIRLARPAKLNSRVSVLRIEEECEKVTKSARCYISGWGATNPQTPEAMNDQLKFLRVSITDNNDCSGAYKQNFLSDDSIVCAKANDLSAGFCKGDRGGPLVCFNSNNKEEVVGIASFQRGCVARNFPGVYTNIAHYFEWIFNNIADDRSSDLVRCYDSNGYSIFKNMIF